MKNILGLDLGTNSIGWALVSMDENGNYVNKIKLGSRIIPMSQDVLGKFDSGVTESQTAVRTNFRGIRRIRERSLLRRERLHRVLHVLGYLPEHYDKALGWDKKQGATYGKFLADDEPKLAWRKTLDGKWEFIFMDSFREMLADFAQHQPSLVADGRRIPLDWTLYFLRKKALTQAIAKEELAWILLNFNQKRGYYQLRGEEEEENPTKKEEFHELMVVGVEATDRKQGDKIWYHVHLENGWTYPRSSNVPLDNWVGKKRQFIVTTEYEKDGVTLKTDKEGNVKRSFRAPGEDDWGLRKKRTEHELELSRETVGAFIYSHLLKEPADKIKGNFVRTIERKYYKNELRAILTKQMEFHAELRDKAILENCVRELYAKNEAHRNSLLKKDFVYLLLDDLLFYQRPLKSKKSLISECPYESYSYVDKATGEIKKQGIKCIARSNPYFQEFRLWQFIHNLRIFDEMNEEVTKQYLKDRNAYASLFLYLNNLKSIKQETLFKDYFGVKKPKGKDSKYPIRWNYVEDKEYPCNETRYEILRALGKAGLSETAIDTSEKLYKLWHLLYSVEDKQELENALRKLNRGEEFVEVFRKIKPFEKQYGAYSEKAIKKLLKVMRMGALWSADDKDEAMCSRMQDIMNGNIDQNIMVRMGTKYRLESWDDFQGLPVWLACYVIYGRHSEVDGVQRWTSPDALMAYIKGFKQHSLRNPIVEQCILETLRTVHDIWKENGSIDEIHVELGRSMKSTADQRKRQTQGILRNENTNLRIKYLLQEMKNDASIENVRPYSPMQQDILRIYEEGALQALSSEDKEYDDIIKLSQAAQPSQEELKRYRLWLDQKYCSPYTGRPISLSKLFTAAYQIEHIIPQSRFFDDSFSNKVICESEVNALKTNMLGYEFIKKHGGQIVHCTAIGDVTIFSEEEYTRFVNEHFSGNNTKKSKLMMEDIPEKFLERQINDTRYISKVVKALLSNIVREDNEQEATSKNVIPCTGGITDRLKKDWGLNDVWNTLVYPRYERLNRLTNSDIFGHWENKEGKRVFQTSIPMELQKGYQKKRIDHRHHAMDALVIACASRNIISYLNNESAKDTQRREDLRRLLCSKNRVINKPWPTFTQDVHRALDNIIVSFKNYVRVINKATNYYEGYDERGKKISKSQKGNELWAIRKPLHKETVFGHVNLRRKETVALSKALENVVSICNKELRLYINEMVDKKFNKKQLLAHFKSLDYRWNRQDVSKVEVWTMSDEKEPLVATRKPLDDTFDKKRIGIITDTGIQKILLNYLEAKGCDPKVAFTPEGIVEMNRNICDYNDGKRHQPILKVRLFEPMGAKYQVGQTGNKQSKYVEAQKGTNLYFAIYEDCEGKRSFETVPLNEVAERLKQAMSPVPEKDKNGNKLKFYLSPNDLVYVPTEEERLSDAVNINKERIYKMVSATGNQCFFVNGRVANPIANKIEFSSLNKMEKSVSFKNNDEDEGFVQMIKNVCWKLEVDRLGNIIQVIR